MNHRLHLGLLVTALAISGLLGAGTPAPDQPEPPIRLQKKQKPAPLEPAPENKPDAPAKEADNKDNKDTARKLKVPGEKEDAGDAKDAPAKDPEAEMKETLARVAKNMRATEERLAKVDAGDGTRQLQHDILDDLDSLIKQSQQAPNSSSGKQGDQSKDEAKQDSGKQSASGQDPGQGGNQKSSDKNKSGKGSEGSSGPDDAQGNKSKGSGQASSGQDPGEAGNSRGSTPGSAKTRQQLTGGQTTRQTKGRQNSGQGGTDQTTAQGNGSNSRPSNSGLKKRSKQLAGTRKPGQGGSQKPGEGGQPKSAMADAGKSDKEINKLADLYKDIWGHLPETMRQEMDQYSREEFMAKYSDLLKQYYDTIARRGQRKED